MRYRVFGRLGWRVSEIGLGTWALGGSWGAQDDRDSVSAVRRALDKGVNLIDTAAGYGKGRSERVVAEAVAGRRNQVLLVTKIPPVAGNWPPWPHERVDDRYPEAHLRASLEERLRSLGTECIDVVLLHVWSRAWNRDPRPLEFLRRARREGKIRAFGISTPDHDQDQLNTLLASGSIDVVQLAYNLFEQQPAAEALPLARQAGVAVMGRLVFDEGSLAGRLTLGTRFAGDDWRGRYFAGDRLERTLARVRRIEADLAGSGFTLPQAAIKFALEDPAMSAVIPGMRSAGQVDANTAVSDLPDLPPPLVEKLRAHGWLRGNWHAGK